YTFSRLRAKLSKKIFGNIVQLYKLRLAMSRNKKLRKEKTNYVGAFRSFYWGFLLTMLDFRINGFDILPDILGFIFFAIGINALLAESEHFQQAQKFNLVMILLSIF